MPDVQKDDIGTIFRLTLKNAGLPLDVSSATVTKDLIFTAPSGTKVTKAASFTTDGKNGQIQYVSTTGVINEAGMWRMQGSVVITAGTFKSSLARFDVGANL